MSLNLRMPEQTELKPRILVFGVGGAGGNAVNNMIDKQLEGAEFVVANTDAQALTQSRAQRQVQLGALVTEGLGAGAKPTVGAAAAEESIEEIVDHLAGSHMCFITAGMGGGTGTGGAPIIAQAAREMGILTVGVVTKPFQFEGSKRMRQADEGIAELQQHVDTLIIIPNQNLFRLANEKTTFTEAFMMADDVLYQGVKGVTDLMVRPGLINLDFADVRSVMDEMGKAMMGTGEAEGENRAIEAAERAIANPLLDEISLKGARGVLINVTGGPDMTLFELDEAAGRIRKEVDDDANIIVGSTMDPSLDGILRVSVVATGIEAVAHEKPLPAAASQPAPAAIAEPAPQPVNRSAADAAPAPVSQAAAASPTTVADLVRARHVIAEEQPLAPASDARQPELPVQQPATAGEPTAEPTPDTMRRLQAAVAKQPSHSTPPRPTTRTGEERKPAFGINSLINRMTGHSDAAPAPRQQPVAERPAAPAPAAAPKPRVVQSAPRPADRLDDDERQRIEIPAFLRRQAN
ncbi:cell division protein FtsZ [Pontivivens nitratireducens]|uniref:Cell division protein FtsZ n=1 Tax=Pontivivens nitratireducens TaxID=2758038 RepID=A0A6G7VKV7_9RHOB|nr:cell division protein FtsZ [Pontibrevibacter nitratireducens]QIK40427.1 cell division protein FtsZ [Pontibrevibacter nitratireducens]